MKLVLIPPGEFLMGSTPEQNARRRKMAEDAKVNSDGWDLARLERGTAAAPGRAREALSGSA